MVKYLLQAGLRTLHEKGPELQRAISGNLDEMVTAEDLAGREPEVDLADLPVSTPVPPRSPGAGQGPTVPHLLNLAAFLFNLYLLGHS